jgi:hypothetical protein
MTKFLLLFFLGILFLSCKKIQRTSNGETGPDAPTFDAEVVRLSDINFPDQQYSIDFLLYIDYQDSSNGSSITDYANLIRIRNTKRKPDINRVYLTDDKPNNEKNLALEVNCIIDKNWNVTGYPFDDQSLSIDIYTPAYDSSKLIFHINRLPIIFQDINNFESGWIPDTAYTSKNITYEKFDKKAKNHSVFSFQVPIHRESPFFIFWKLFAGMYIAFLVSFVALFLNIEHVEPRFGLPVGGLFAAIANKYIIESFLPLTPKLTLVDGLHDITIFAIFLIIAFSAISLELDDIRKKIEIPISDTNLFGLRIKGIRKKHLMNRINAINPFLFFSIYVATNILVVLIAIYH